MKAIFLAAGKGTRLFPYTLKYPKPLFKINNKSILEHNIQFLLEHNINEFILVSGYKNEYFNDIVKKYNIKMVISTEYESKNSSSSLFLVKEYINDSLIINADIYIRDNFIKYMKKGVSQIISKKINNSIEDGYISNKSNGRITKIVRKSTSGYGDTGIMYLCGIMAEKVAENLKYAEDDEFWEDVVYKFIDDYPLYITKIPDIITEIDSIKDIINGGLLSDKELIDLCENDITMIEIVKKIIDENKI
ncbi:sugar phosphate nucleotidyltransferase [Brachyspira sp.]|uniref:sugar phosphate nucleotidyltransferase n=1 Tax=Brachyspira sp. TaxID=1977261 RepID=UPI00260E750B|nr:sugar phosphate nucleotidyltransferase [Brachyspira sp.]